MSKVKKRFKTQEKLKNSRENHKTLAFFVTPSTKKASKKEAWFKQAHFWTFKKTQGEKNLIL